MNKKEYNQLAEKYNGKSYNNFIDLMRAVKKKDNWVSAEKSFSSKKSLKKNAKNCRGVKYGTTLKKQEKQYPSWEDVGTYGNDECCYAARYYDKKSGYVVVKGFVLNKKAKVKKIIYIAYNPLHKSNITKLRTW